MPKPRHATTTPGQKTSRGSSTVPSEGSSKGSGGRSGDGGRRCIATTSSGQPCQKRAVPGLTVCSTHGGNTAAARRKATRTRTTSAVAGLWSIGGSKEPVSIEEELTRLATNKLTDIRALRLELGSDPDKYYGLLTDSRVDEKFDIEGTVQSKYGTTRKVTKKSGVHPLVEELHKAEGELVQILRLLQDVTGGTDATDMKRVRMQTAREAARLLKAFPGISVDAVAMEVTKNAS